jgi:hypothetical protein
MFMELSTRGLFRRGVLLAGCALLARFPVLADDAQPTQTYFSEGELEYVGDLDEEANRRLFDLYEALSPKPKVLSIQSPGGEVNAGVTLGFWIRAHRLNVKVLEFCLSSCANYVFPAGIKKIVSNVAIIGYHGGPNTPGRLKLGANAQMMFDALNPAKQKAFMEDLAAISMRDSHRESEYFKRIGVRADISSLGQEDRYEQISRANPGAVGWTYSLEGFALLGVRNILVIDPPWTPGGTSRHMMFVTIPVKKQAERPMGRDR